MTRQESKKSTDEEVGGSFEILMEAVLEDVHQRIIRERDPYEVYSLQIRSKIHADRFRLAERVQNGYLALLAEIH